jgi:hypothetical protein
VAAAVAASLVFAGPTAAAATITAARARAIVSAARSATFRATKGRSFTLLP